MAGTLLRADGLVFTSTIASGLVGSFVLSTHKPTDQEGWQRLMVAFGAISAAAALLGCTFGPRRSGGGVQ